MAAGFFTKTLSTLLSSVSRWVEFGDGTTAPVHGAVLIDPATGLPPTDPAAVSDALLETAVKVTDSAFGSGMLGVAAIYDNANPVRVNNAAAPLLLDSRGNLRVSLVGNGASVAIASLGDNVDDVAASSSANAVKVHARNTRFNGSSWDRHAKPNATARLTSSAASTNATVAKASAGNIHSIDAYNNTASYKVLKIYNRATNPTVGTDPVRCTFVLPPNAAFNRNFADPIYCNAGIAYSLTTLVSDADATAVASGDILGLNIQYS